MKAQRWAYEIAGIPLPRDDEEHREQSAFIEWVDFAARKRPELSLLYAIPNGGHRKPATAARLKAEGVRPGVPDLHLPLARRNHAGLWIEFKSATGKLSKAQKERVRMLRDEGHMVILARKWDVAKAVVEWYIGATDALPEV